MRRHKAFCSIAQKIIHKVNYWHLFKDFLEKAMAPHSSTLAWKIPWTEEPGRLRSIGSQRVGHDWVTSLSIFTFMCWRRKWQPTPVFLPRESQGQGSLVGCRLWGHTESTWLKWLSSSISKDFYKRVFQDKNIGCSLRPWEGLIYEAYLWGECLWQRSLLNLGLRNN